MLTLFLLFYLFIAIIITLVLFLIFFIIKKIVKDFNKKEQDVNDEYSNESIIDCDKVDEKSEEDLINDINENDSVKTKIKNKIRFCPIKYYFLVAIIIFLIGFIAKFNIINTDNKIIFPNYPTDETLFIQLKDGNILKIGGRLTKPERLKLGVTDKFVITSFAEIYNVKEKKFEPLENTHFPLYRSSGMFSDGTVLQDGIALLISSKENRMDIYDPVSRTFTLSKNVFFHHAGGSVRLTEMGNGNIFIVSGKEYIVYNPDFDKIIIHRYNNSLGEYPDYFLNLINLSNGNVLITFNNGACIYNPYEDSIKEVSISNFAKRFYADTIPLGIPVKLHDNRILFFSALQGQDCVLFFNENTEQFEFIGKLTKSRPLSTPVVLNDNNVYIIGSHFISNDDTFISNTIAKIKALLTFKDYVSPANRVSCEIYDTKTNTSKLTNIRPHLVLHDENMQVFLYGNEVIITPSGAAYRNKQGKYNYGSNLIEHINIRKINK